MLTGKRFVRTFTAAALSVALVFSVSAVKAPAQAASSINDLQSQQALLQQKEKEIDSQLSKLKNDKAKQLEYKQQLDAKISNVEGQIDSLNGQITQLDADIVAKQAQISAKQKNIDENFTKLKQRVYALYLTGEASNIEIVLNAKNIMDLADKTEMLQVISEHDTKIIDALKMI